MMFTSCFQSDQKIANAGQKKRLQLIKSPKTNMQ